MKTKPLNLALAMVALAYGIVHAQVGIGTNSPDSSAALEIHSSDRGFLLPRLTTSQIYYINGPETGLLVYNSDSLDIWCYNGKKWVGVFDENDTLNPDIWYCGLDVSFAGQYYSTHKIGNDCWMTKNLNVGGMIEGSQFPSDDGQVEKKCYDNTIVSCIVYGGLYTWNEMMSYTTVEGAQGICPTDWHIPSDDEWKVLEGSVDSIYGVGDPEWNNFEWRGANAGGSLKESGTTHWQYPNLGATNKSGFNALPGGYVYTNGTFENQGLFGIYWTSTQHDETIAYGRLIHYYSKLVARYFDYTKSYGFSVRCVKN